jgi:hypothetical protein
MATAIYPLVTLFIVIVGGTMALIDSATRLVADRLPKVIDPKTHAVIDYVVAGTFLAMGAFFWKRNKRAAIGALTCGGAAAATSMLTDYPGGVKKYLSFETHGKIDAGLAGLTAMVPNIFAFKDEDEAAFFRTMAVAETVVAGLTDFTRPTGKLLLMPRPRTA